MTALLAALLPAQPNKTGLSKTLYASNPVFAEDAGCAKDYAKIFELDGVALRKATAELIAYGCVEKLNGLYSASVVGSMSASGVQLRHVRLTLIEPLVFGNAPRTAEGWMRSSDIESLSADELKATIARIRQVNRIMRKTQ